MKKIVILDTFVAAAGGLSWDEISQLGELTAYDRTEPHDTLDSAEELSPYSQTRF